MIFDTHAHYYSRYFDDDRDKLLQSLPEQGIGGVVIPGCTVEESWSAAALAKRYPHVWAAAGIHPMDCAETTDDDLEAIRALCEHPKVVAVGEIGLDYDRRDDPPESHREKQREVFRRQLDLALDLGLPVIVHDRDAHQDCLAVVREYPGIRGVFHCYSGSVEMAQELLRLGWYLGFDGPVTYKNARRAVEVAAITPPDRILVETDAPYLPPVPYRGQRNDSTKLPLVLEKLSEVTGVSAEELERITWENALRLFDLPIH